MDESEKFDKRSLPEKEDFYSRKNMEDITSGDFRPVKRVWENLNLKTEVIIMIYTFKVLYFCWLMSFSMFRICVLKYMNLNPSCYLTAPGLAWQAALRAIVYSIYLEWDHGGPANFIVLTYVLGFIETTPQPKF